MIRGHYMGQGRRMAQQRGHILQRRLDDDVRDELVAAGSIAPVLPTHVATDACRFPPNGEDFRPRLEWLFRHDTRPPSVRGWVLILSQGCSNVLIAAGGKTPLLCVHTTPDDHGTVTLHAGDHLRCTYLGLSEEPG
jgi:hypothetical protein